jgi:hypothetical protein
MNRAAWITFALPCLATLLLAQPVQEASRPTLRELESVIQAELEGHGDRVMGKDAYHWSTRLERFDNCRAQLTVTVTSTLRELIVRIDHVSFSLGAIERLEIEPQKNWLALPCAEH